MKQRVCGTRGHFSWMARAGLAALAVGVASSQAVAQTEKPSPDAIKPIKVKKPTEPPKSPAPLPAPDAAGADAAADGPKAVIPEPTKDFGEFWAGADLTHAFVVKNAGAKVLKILKVKPACGCTSTGYDKEIAPGAEGKINVKVRTKNFNGKFSKGVTVTTDDPANTTLRLKLSGIAKQYVSVVPRSAAFTQVQPDQVLSKTIKITNNSDEPMALSLRQEKTGVFTAALKELEAGKSYELEITGNPPYQAKLNRATFHLTTNVSAKPTVDVPCTAYVPPRLEMRPDRIQLRGPQKRSAKRTLQFKNNGKTDVKVVAVELDDPKVTTAVREQRPGKDYAIDITFPQGYEPPDKGARLLVKLDDSETAQMTVPITKIKPPKPRPRPGEKLVGNPAPKIDLQTVDGKTIKLGETSDDVLVLEFYASWCGFCKRTLPDVEKVHQKYKDKGVRVIAISEDTRGGRRGRTEDQIAQHFDSLKLSMERSLDPTQAIGKAYFAKSYPTLYLVGKTGKVEAAHFGAKRNLVDVLSRDLDQLIAGKSLAKRPSAKTAGSIVPVKGDAARREVTSTVMPTAKRRPVATPDPEN